MRKSDSLPVTDSDLDRTPILGNVIAHDCITFRMQGRDIPLQMLQSARDEAESYRERMTALTAERDALRKALQNVRVRLMHGPDDIYQKRTLIIVDSALALVDGAE